MTTTPPPPPPPAPPAPPAPPPPPAAAPTPDPAYDTGPRVGLDDVRDLSRLRRTVGAERSVAGVAGGLGRHLDIDPVLLKVAFVVLSFFGGVGLLLYAACWLLIPDEHATSAPLGLDDRSRSTALVVVGAVAGLALLGTTLGVDVVPLPLVLLAVVGLVVVLQVDKRRQRRRRRHAGSLGSAEPGSAGPAGSGQPSAEYPDHLAVPPGPPGPPGPSYPSPAYPHLSTPAPLPRKPGPVLFWFSLALAALGIGVLVTLDLAGVPVPASAYPALVLALSGAMLVLGAFWGRAGGLILLGLLALVTLGGTVLAEAYDGVELRETPTSAAEVQPSYTFEAGELVLDLREVADVAALDGRTITITGEVGSIEVVTPSGVGVTAQADIEGPGVVDVLGGQDGGLSAQAQSSVSGEPAAPAQLRIEAELGVGAIDIRTADEGTDR